MKKTLKSLVAGILAVPIMALTISSVMPTATVAAQCDGSSNITDSTGCMNPGDLPTNLFGDNGIFKKVINMLLYILGAVSVIMIIYGGIRYTISGGNAATVTAAKNTILYAIIGLVVALLSFSAVDFVLKWMLDK